jgi:hypothetical protein
MDHPGSDAGECLDKTARPPAGSLASRAMVSLLEAAFTNKAPIETLTRTDGVEIIALDGGMAFFSRKARLRWALAIAFIHVVLAFEGVVYGGFIRDMLSGIMFNDIDININGGRSRMKDFESVVRWMVSSALGLPHRSVQFEVFDISSMRVGYLQSVTTYIISVEFPDAGVIEFNVDVSPMRPTSGNSKNKPAATRGSSLCYDVAGWGFHNPADSTKMLLSDITAMLKAGHDAMTTLTFSQRDMLVDNGAIADAYFVKKCAELAERGHQFLETSSTIMTAVMGAKERVDRRSAEAIAQRAEAIAQQADAARGWESSDSD